MEGELLIQSLVQAIGLPESYMNRELNQMIERAGLNRESLTLDQLRPLLAELVQEVLLDNKRALNEA